MVTMQEVAAHAGVSIATVSFVVNATKPVSPQTKARVEASMAELGYRRNAVARALASRRTHIIALAHPVLERPFNPGSVEFFTGAAAEASSRGYHLMIWPVSNDGRELSELVGQQLVAGVLLMEVQLDDERVEVLQRAPIPYALIGRTRDLDEQHYVDIDFDATMGSALDHLTSLGHRRIALVLGGKGEPGFRTYGPFARSAAAFATITEAAQVSGRVVEVARLDDPVHLAAQVVGGDGGEPAVTAALVMNDHTALRLVSGLRRSGHRVPEDVSVVGLSAAPETGALSDPPLTLLRTPGPELGRLGVEMLIRSLEGDEPLPPRLVPCTFEPGGTTAEPGGTTAAPR